MELRSALPKDIPAVHALLRELIEIENNQENFTATTSELYNALFGESPKMSCWVVQEGELLLGAAMCSPGFVAASCQPILRLLSLVVRDGHRGTEIGSALLTHVAEYAVAAGYDSLDFMVRETNVLAQSFYSRHGAIRRVEWQTWRLPRSLLKELAGDSSDP